MNAKERCSTGAERKTDREVWSAKPKAKDKAKENAKDKAKAKAKPKPRADESGAQPFDEFGVGADASVDSVSS